MGEAYIYKTCLFKITSSYSGLGLKNKTEMIQLIGKLLDPLATQLAKNSPIGPHHVAVAKQYGKSVACFGFAGAVLGCYLMEWKAVLQFVPYYNGKYAEKE